MTTGILCYIGGLLTIPAVIAVWAAIETYGTHKRIRHYEDFHHR